MNQPRFGEVRIVTYNGEGDNRVPIRELGKQIITAQLDGKGIVELSARKIGTDAPIMLDTSREEAVISCQTNTTCPITISMRVDGRVIANAKGAKFPESCLGCITNRMTSALGFITQTPQRPVITVEEI